MPRASAVLRRNTATGIFQFGQTLRRGRLSGCGNLADRQLGRHMRVGVVLRVVRRMGASSGTLPGAGTQRVLDDLVDGAGAATAFGAAAKAAIDLPCCARTIGRGADRAADVIIAQNIAGTDDQDCLPGDVLMSIIEPGPCCKMISINFKQFQTALVKAGAIWNESKQALTRRAYRFNSGLPATRWSRKSRDCSPSVLPSAIEAKARHHRRHR